MKYNVGDKVRINSIDWYNENKYEDGDVPCGEYNFVSQMSVFCGKILTIDIDYEDGTYLMKEDTDGFVFTDEMIECLVERNGKTYPYKIGDRIVLKGNHRCATITDLKYNSFGNLSYYIKIDNDRDVSVDIYDNMIEGLAKDEMSLDKAGQITDFEYDGLAYALPDGYQFVDENDNPINATKISLRKKKEIIPNLKLDSIRTVKEYCTKHSRIWLEIYEDKPKECVFTHLWVDKDYRRKGYGTKAIEQAEIIAKGLGCETIYLKVETDSWMHKWYLRSGYSFLTSAKDNYTWLTKNIWYCKDDKNFKC